ncbi:MAG: TRAP transporter small permease [Rhizobiaceae bacterium]|nr:TRAP transporter small permease [Rhizobiaceae bacterium]
MDFDDNTIADLARESETDTDKRLRELKFSAADIPVLLIFLILFATVFAQFFTRYVLNDSLSWTEEAARYLLIVLAFAGGIKCQSLDSHIRLEFIDQLAARHVGKLKAVALVLTIAFFAVLGWSLTRLAMQTSFQHMVSLPFPKYYLYAVILVLIACLIGLQLIQLAKIFRGRKP